MALHKKQAQNLKRGDVLRRGEEVLGVSQGLNTPRGKVEVTYRTVQGKVVTGVWGKTTPILCSKQSLLDENRPTKKGPTAEGSLRRVRELARLITEDPDISLSTNKVLVWLEIGQLDITEFLEEYEVTSNAELKAHTENGGSQQLLGYTKRFYSKHIDEVTGGGGAYPEAKLEIDFEPEFQSLSFSRVFKDYYEEDKGYGEPEEKTEILLMDCRMKALVKFEEYVNYIIQISSEEYLDQIEVINSNGVDIHGIVADAYDREVAEVEEKIEQDPYEEEFEELLSLTRPIMKYRTDSLRSMKLHKTIHHSRLIKTGPGKLDRVEYTLRVGIGNNEWGGKEYFLAVWQSIPAKHIYDNPDHPQAKEWDMEHKNGQAFSRVGITRTHAGGYYHDVESWPLDDREDALIAIKKACVKFQAL